MDLHQTFPLRYYINLGRRQDRRAETEIALHQAGITAERWPAIDSRFVKRNRGYESAGRYALALSQRLALRSASLKKAEAVLIMEDDVVFHPRLLEHLQGIELPDDWGIFYLGCAHHKRPWPAGENLVRTPYALDTHAFAVRAPYYRKVMAALARRDNDPCFHPRASDWFLADLHQEIPTYSCYPNLAWQAASNSDLAGGVYSNYTPSGEQIAAAGELIGVRAQMWGGSRWHGQALGHAPQPEPKLGMLFLTREDVNHPQIWREFVSDSGGDVRVFCHAKGRAVADQGFLRGFSIDEWHDTNWGEISLVRAMIGLLKAALKDESLTHFAFASESCVPVKPWSEIRRRLRIDPRSMMGFDDGNTMGQVHQGRLAKIDDLPRRDWRAHSQWVLLDREAARCVVEDDFTQRFSGIVAADEHYFGSVMSLRGYPDWEKVNRQDPTWVKWADSRPLELLETSPELAAELAGFQGFFARKFPMESDIGRWGLHRY